MFDSDVDTDTTQVSYLYSYALNKSKEILTSVYGVSGQNLQLFFNEAIHHLGSEFCDFDNFQLKILKIFLTVLFLNVVVIVILWSVYKDRIYERFIQPSSTCIIEELRKSVSQLKLPRGHSPRV